MPLDLRRGRTSRERLEIAWTYPVWQPAGPAAKPGATTAAVEREHALPLAEAVAWITAGDKRPLLVLRECERCRGTDHALLSRTLDNEQTMLLTGWFRCVKLPTNVLETDHPFTNLFEEGPAGQRIPHLFFCDADGANRTPLPGDQSQADLWKTMFGFLDRAYTGNAKKALKELRSLLSQYDKLDSLEEEIMQQLDAEYDRNGPNSPKAAKYQAKIERLHADRDKLRQQEREIRDLALIDLATGEPAAPSDNATDGDR